MNELKVIEHKEVRVLTTQQLAEVYETQPDNIKMNFKRNKERFVEGRDYYLLKGGELKEFKNLVTNSNLVDKRTPQLYLWTERGANRHSKILDTDKAWQQFDVLEETYFRAKQNKVIDMSNPMNVLRVMFGAMDNLETNVKLINTRIDNIEKDKNISQSEYSEIGTLVSKRINTVIKNEQLVVTRKQRQKLIQEFNHDIAIITHTKHRNQIKKSDYHKVLDFINDWQPSRATIIGILGYEQQELFLKHKKRHSSTNHS